MRCEPVRISAIRYIRRELPSSWMLEMPGMEDTMDFCKGITLSSSAKGVIYMYISHTPCTFCSSDRKRSIGLVFNVTLFHTGMSPFSQELASPTS